MDSKCNTDQLKRDGSSQQGRYLKALDPANLPLDDRSVQDILVFAKHYAGLVRYYDENENVEWAGAAEADNYNAPVEKEEPGKSMYDWKEFFYQDIAVVVASIAGYSHKLESITQDYNERRKQTDQNPNIQNFRELFKVITHLMQRVDRWYKRSIPEHPLQQELELKIKSVLRPALKKLMGYDRGSSVVNDGGIEIEEEYALFANTPWNLKYKSVQEDESIYEGNTDRQKIKKAALYVDDIFQETLKVYREITDRSDFYFAAAINNYPDHQPHMALFLAFTRLFMYAQKEMNGLTQRHLEFYYRDVLRLHERAAHPDAAYLIYELAKEATEYELKAGTALTAGKDATGKELIYKTAGDLTINKAKVKELKTLFLEKINEETIGRLYASPVANSADGKGKTFTNPESAWPAMGYFSPAFDDAGNIINKIGEEAQIGFAIASPQLYLAEGEREITIDFTFKEKVDPVEMDLTVMLTGEKGWVRFDNIKAQYPDEIPGKKILRAAIPLLVSEQAIVGYDINVHADVFQTSYPVIKFILPDSTSYNFLKAAVLQNISITVVVSGVKNLILENDQSVLDASKAILPFTQTPKKGYSLYIGSREVFYKKLDALSIQFDNIEEAEPLDARPVVAPEVHNLDNTQQVTTLNIAMLNRRKWEYTHIKNIAAAGNVNAPYAYNRVIDVFREGVNLVRNRETDYHEFADKNNSLAGFMRIDLVSDVKTAIEINDKRTIVTLPKTFNLKNLAINYRSTQSYVDGIEQMFHVYPFGLVEIFADEELTADQKAMLEKIEKSTNNLVIPTPLLLPQFKFGNKDVPFPDNYIPNQYDFATYQQGNLYIGIEHLNLPQNLSLLFKIADGTAEDNDNDPPVINWSYLVNNEWRPLPPQNIISDSTYGLKATGIILIDFPADAGNNNTLMTPGLFWLCASADKHTDRLPKIINVIAQANKVILTDEGNDPNHYKIPLPANSITKLSVKAPEVKLIQQPFETFDGKMREEGKVFYARASERLRHKHRAITPWDYEHLVLQHFPSVYKVKCITHTDPNCICRHPRDGEGNPVKDRCCCGLVAPGHVLIIPVSNLRNKEAVDILKPRTGRRTLLQIGEYLQKLTSTFVHVHVQNPAFEEIKTAFNVKFYTGTDKGRYLKQLNEDIIRFLTPWAFDKNKELVFGAGVYASAIINFIEELEYVDYITCFRMIHIVKGCCDSDTLEELTCAQMQKKDAAFADRFETLIEASSPKAILTSVKQHCISLIDEAPKEDCRCS
jgi:hypothetical protein